MLLFELSVVCATLRVEAADTSASKADIDYNIWVLGMPTGTILSSGDLKKQLYNNWWYPGTGEFEGYDMFQTPQKGAGEKAFGSMYTRSELAEIIPSSGDRSGAWGTIARWGSLGYHKMVTEVKVAVINDNPRGDYAKRDYTCIGQVWGYSNGQPAMFELFYHNAKFGDSSFSMRQPQTSGSVVYAPVHIPVGKAFTATYECIDGVLKVWVESKEASVPKTQIYEGALAIPDSSSYYFKVGNYDQSSDSKGDTVPNPRDVHTLVGFKSIITEHNPIKGRLTYANGNPVANQVIDYVLNGGGVSNLKLSTKTDAEGYYYIANVPSNGGVTTASVSITVPAISGYKSDKTGAINIAAAATSSIKGVRSGDAYNIVYTSTTQTSKESTPNASVDYVAETLKGLNGAYTINGKSVNITGAYPIDASWFGTTISIVKKGSGIISDSDIQRLTIKARSSTPKPRTAACTTQQNNDGVISNVTNMMEYRASNSVTWQAITGSSIRGLNSGTYYVRVKATSTTFKSDSAIVVINAYNSTTTPASIVYVVQYGDSLWLIGQKFGVTVDAIKNLNGLTSNMIYPRQQLQIPSNYITYTVKYDDTLWLLSQKYNTTVNVIKTLNGLTSDMIYPGQQLRIPT
jgi:LysM repeat protein